MQDLYFLGSWAFSLVTLVFMLFGTVMMVVGAMSFSEAMIYFAPLGLIFVGTTAYIIHSIK